MPKPNDFSYYNPTLIKKGQGVPPQTDPTPMPNIVDAFKNLDERGDDLVIFDGDLIPVPSYKPYDVEVIKGKVNHFQGIQRLTNSDHMILSGGDKKSGHAHLFVAQLKSRATNDFWRSNLRDHLTPDPGDQIVSILRPNLAPTNHNDFPVNPSLWHAGGLSVLGDVAAVPIEGKGSDEGSQILFYDFRDPAKPALLDIIIDRRGRTGGVIGLTRLDSGFFLMAVLYQPDETPPEAPPKDRRRPRGHRDRMIGRHIDFYVSKSNDIMDGFGPVVHSWDTLDVKWEARDVSGDFGNFQAIEFIHEVNTGQLFMAGMYNTSPAAPTVNGMDYVHLFRIEFNAAGGQTEIRPDNFPLESITRVASKHIYSHGNQFNMQAGAGIFIHPKHREVAIYSCYHFKDSGLIRFAEIRQRPNLLRDGIEDTADAWVEFYEHSNYRGRKLSLCGVNLGMDVVDFGSLRAQGSSIDGLVSSVRYQLPGDSTYQLFAEPGHRGQTLTLSGNNGTVQEISNLKDKDFGDRLSSARIV